MKGIDISGYEVGLNFNDINTDIIIIKATEGLTYINPLLKLQYNKARSIGCKVGFYHYLRANNPIEEAKHFLNAIEGLKSDCKYIIDCESEPVGASLRVRKFADYLISKGKEPALYTGLCFYNEEMTSIVKDLPLWVAAYNKTRPIIKSVGWQYSETETIGGQTVDMNIFDEGILLNKVNKVANKVDYCKEFQMFYNKVTDTGAPLKINGYGPKTQHALNTMDNLIKTNSRYCREFQFFYNKATQTRVPLKINGYGPLTQNAMDTMQKLIKEEY